ncbi:hypothetical protein EVAR_85564_1 [Eumeta japonica]|uniref:RNase H type-1 domain-containing protein n=1 Tax=Eumeta variegata TaxID=151549 RepID=A0A4C2AD81_EUMVA|nr:hypothetical protein EVAR_85564_1 [Eumeta japonica]
MGSEQRNNKDHIHSSDRTHHDVRIEHMGSGDRVRNDQIGSKLASKRLTSTGPQNTGSGGAVQSKKKGLSMDYLPPGKELEKDIANTERPHPAKAMSIEYELVDESDPDPLGKIAGPQIYTDGSKINGRVGAAITWWTNDTESEYQTLSLHPSCSVYQAEMYALYRAVAMVKASREKVVNILSDSRSSLELLSNPRTGHPLAHAIRESTRNANAEGKEIRFYWLRAHVGKGQRKSR